ncbi:MAG: hypothetical protein AAGB01_04500, partial [Cyanobacteria bacterium P01_F01_bin.42]
MTDWNSTVEHQLRPDELMAELDIKKQTYYNYLDHLGIKASKDSKGKVYLTQAQADQLRSLRSHVLSGGKIEAFRVSNSAESGLVKAESNGLGAAESGELNAAAERPQVVPTDDIDFQALHREASKIAAHRMTAGHHLVLAMADQMTYEDLHPDSKAEVDQVREATVPKFDAQVMATDLLSQFR